MELTSFGMDRVSYSIGDETLGRRGGRGGGRNSRRVILAGLDRYLRADHHPRGEDVVYGGQNEGVRHGDRRSEPLREGEHHLAVEVLYGGQQIEIRVDQPRGRRVSVPLHRVPLHLVRGYHDYLLLDLGLLRRGGGGGGGGRRRRRLLLLRLLLLQQQPLLMLQVRGSDGKTVVDGRVLGIEARAPRPRQRVAGLGGGCPTLRQHPLPLRGSGTSGAGAVRLGGPPRVGQGVRGRQEAPRHGLLLQQIRDAQGIVLLLLLLVLALLARGATLLLVLLVVPVTVQRLAAAITTLVVMVVVVVVIPLALLRAATLHRRGGGGEAGGGVRAQRCRGRGRGREGGRREWRPSRLLRLIGQIGRARGTWTPLAFRAPQEKSRYGLAG